MSLFLWKKSYEIGIAEIDMQHRRLVGYVNELADAMMARQGHRAAPHVLEELVDYIQLHFTAEEKVMRETHYPQVEEHCREHLEMTGKILDFRTKFAIERALDPAELLNFLCDWLKNHIIVSDKDFGRYLRRTKLELT